MRRISLLRQSRHTGPGLAAARMLTWPHPQVMLAAAATTGTSLPLEG